MKKAAGYIALDIVVTNECGQYCSWCPQLDIASCGDSFEEAIDNLRDALELYLDTLQEEGEQEQVFKERCIQIIGEDEPVMPTSFVTQYRQRVAL